MTTSLPPGFGSMFEETTAADVDGSEVRLVAVTVSGWADASGLLSKLAAALEGAAIAAGMTVERVAVNPLREVC